MGNATTRTHARIGLAAEKICESTAFHLITGTHCNAAYGLNIPPWELGPTGILIFQGPTALSRRQHDDRAQHAPCNPS